MRKLKELRNALLRAWQWLIGNLSFIWLKVRCFFHDLYYWIVQFYFVFISTKSRMRIFQGWGHFWLARKYCDRRTKLSNHQKILGGGKRHHVLPWGQYSLIVINRVELNDLKDRGYFRKGLNIVTLIQTAYYTSK